MLFLLGQYLQQFYGPFRLFTSHLFLAGLGLVGCGLLTYFLLPRLCFLVPRDRGRAFAVDSKQAEGKPTGTGMLFIPLFLLIQILVLPLSGEVLAILALTLAAAVFGFLDDRSLIAWGEYKKGLIDLIIAGLAAAVMCGMEAVSIWLPFTKLQWVVEPWIFIPLSSILIWAAINTTNCADGVDGLSGTLLGIAFLSIGCLLYFAVGHFDVAAYLLLPHLPHGAIWGIMAFSIVGILAGYLWYNAHPSSLLMGDAGSRALGFLLGVMVIKSGNPFVIFMVSAVLLINSGTGLVKVALLRFAKIAIFRSVRFPLHDHVRHKRGWSNTQVLVRFSIVQAMMVLVFMVLLLKLR